MLRKRPVSREALTAIGDYLEQERGNDDGKWQSNAMFLSAATNSFGNGRLGVRNINNIWGEICRLAGIRRKSPHSARHSMGKQSNERTGGNISAVARQLGHKNIAYSVQYTRLSSEEMEKAVNEDD